MVGEARADLGDPCRQLGIELDLCAVTEHIKCTGAVNDAGVDDVPVDAIGTGDVTNRAHIHPRNDIVIAGLPTLINTLIQRDSPYAIQDVIIWRVIDEIGIHTTMPLQTSKRDLLCE